MIVYMDVVWLLNLLVDSMLLWMTAIILKRCVSTWRILTGGVIGSLLIMMSITPLSVYSGNPFVKLGFSVVMVYVVFGFKRFKHYFSALLTFYFATFLTGGILIGTHYFINFDFQLKSSVLLASIRGFGDPISWIFVLFGIPIAWWFSKRRIDDFEMKKIQFDQLVDVSIDIDGSHFSLKGLVDSGNQLYDPLSKLPVMIVSIDGCQDKIPKQIVEVTEDSDAFIQGEIQLPSEWTDRIRFIPAQTVGKSNQLLLAYKPDHINIQNGNESWVVKRALISFTNQKLSNDGIFQCIVHPKMLTGIPIKSAS